MQPPATTALAAERRPVCYLGDFASPHWKRFFERERAVLHLAGIDVVHVTGREFAERAEKGGNALIHRASLIFLDPADASLARAIRDAPAPVLIRLFDHRRLRRCADLFRRRASTDGRPTLIAPADRLLRDTAAADMGEAALAEGAWGPLLDPACTAIAFRGRAVSVLRPRFQGSPEAAARLRRRLDGIPGSPGRGHAREVLLFLGEPGSGTSPLARAVRSLERGIPVVATPPWKPCLGDTAVFLPEEAIADLLENWARQPGLLAGMVAERLDRLRPLLGEEAFLARVSALLPPTEASRVHPVPYSHRDVDLLLIGDFARPGETVLRVAARAIETGARGRRVAFLHLSSGPAGMQDPPDARIRALVLSNRAMMVDPAVRVPPARRIEIHDVADSLPLLERHRPPLRAREWILYEPGDPDRAVTAPEWQERLQRLYPCSPRWTTPSPFCWRLLATRVPVERAPSPPPAVPVTPPACRRGSPVLGTVLFDEADLERVAGRYGEPVTRAGWRLRILFVGERKRSATVGSENTEVLDLPGTDLGRFLSGPDGVLWPEGVEESRLSPTFSASARKAGLPVFAPLGLSVPHVRRALPVEDLPRWGRQTIPRIRATGSRISPRRILFVTANGVGLGHVTRLAAIARWLPRELEPVFATMSQAVGVLRGLGFLAELLPTYTGHPHDIWNRWLRRRMEELLDYHRPVAVVLDASNPYSGILEAVAPRPDVRLIWVRRGMWRAEQDNAAFLARSPCFDLIIEPGELAASRDPGATAMRRDEVFAVDPIGLLEDEDLFSRQEARRLLGLRPGAPAALLQLGSGTTRDVGRLADMAVESLRRLGDVEIVIARWMIADDGFDDWPGVRCLHGFPVGRYFRAFDFTLSAAGYNSFHDILRFGLPAIFIPNEADFMDAQEARAAFAQDAGAAFDLRTSDLDCLGDCLRALMDPGCRALMSRNARALSRPNGARQAAEVIAACIEGQSVRPHEGTVVRGKQKHVRETADA